MGRFTLEQRWEILKFYFQSDCCVAEAVRRLKKHFGQDNAPTAAAIRKFVKKVRETGMLVDNKNYTRVCPTRSAQTIAIVAESVRENPSMSIRHRSQELDISRSTLRRILHNDLKLAAYKAVKRVKSPDKNFNEEEVLLEIIEEGEIESDQHEILYDLV